MTGFDFPQSIVYMGHVCDLSGLSGDRAEYTSIYSNTFVVSFNGDMFGYYEQIGLIERR